MPDVFWIVFFVDSVCKVLIMSAEASLGSEIFFRVLKYVVSLICIRCMLPP